MDVAIRFFVGRLTTDTDHNNRTCFRASSIGAQIDDSRILQERRRRLNLAIKVLESRKSCDAWMAGWGFYKRDPTSCLLSSQDAQGGYRKGGGGPHWWWWAQ